MGQFGRWLKKGSIWSALIGVLISSSGCTAYFRKKQIEGIQLTARADLDLVYRAEMKFRAKHSIYTTDLKALGIAPKYVTYKFGFVTAGAGGTVAGVDPSRKDLDRLKESDPALEINYSPVTKLEQIKMDRLTSFCADCTATLVTFKVVAAANLDEDPVLDVWTIDQEGKVQHLINDLGQ